jgi:hypothetical protein
MTTKLAIAINLDDLRDLMREFMSEVVTDEDNNIYAWPFETFLQWAMKRQREEKGNDTQTSSAGKKATDSGTEVLTGENSVIVPDERLQGAS